MDRWWWVCTPMNAEVDENNNNFQHITFSLIAKPCVLRRCFYNHYTCVPITHTYETTTMHRTALIDNIIIMCCCCYTHILHPTCFSALFESQFCPSCADCVEGYHHIHPTEMKIICMPSKWYDGFRRKQIRKMKKAPIFMVLHMNKSVIYSFSPEFRYFKYSTSKPLYCVRLLLGVEIEYIRFDDIFGQIWKACHFLADNDNKSASFTSSSMRSSFVHMLFSHWATENWSESNDLG